MIILHGVQDRRNHILTHMSYLITQLQGKDVELVFRKDEDHYFLKKRQFGSISEKIVEKN